MRQHRFLSPTILVILILCCLPGSSSAQSNNRFTVGVMFGVGGATASEPASATVDDVFLLEDEFGTGFQLLFNMEVRRGVLFAARYGQLDAEIANNALASLGAPVETELTYFTAGGEYRLSEGQYQSGLVLGTGFYSVDGQNVFDDDSGLGLNFGVTGDFRIRDRWSFLLDFSAHYADLDSAQFFLMGHAGLAFHF